MTGSIVCADILAGCVGTRQFKTPALQTYGTCEVPFIMQTDRADLSLPVPAAGQPAAPVSAQP